MHAMPVLLMCTQVEPLLDHRDLWKGFIVLPAHLQFSYGIKWAGLLWGILPAARICKAYQKKKEGRKEGRMDRKTK